MYIYTLYYSLVNRSIIAYVYVLYYLWLIEALLRRGKLAVEHVKYLCLFPSVTGEVYCFPRRQFIFSFGRRVTFLKRLAGLGFYLKSSMLYINGFVSASSTN